MGNCIYFDRPSSAKLQQNQEPNPVPKQSHLSSPTINKLPSSTFTPIPIHQPFVSPVSPVASPIPIPIVSHRQKSNTTLRSPSSSGVSSASSSSASANVSKATTDNTRFQYIAIYDYDARTKEDLTIKKGDLLEIIKRKSTAWWTAKNESGQEGWIPSNYVAKQGSLESEPYVLSDIVEQAKNSDFIFLDGISNPYVESMQRNN